MIGFRVLEDRLPVVRVTPQVGEELILAPAVLTDDAALDLYRVLRGALTGAVVRLDSIPRVELRPL